MKKKKIGNNATFIDYSNEIVINITIFIEFLL